ncbi:MAG TPA: DEAD/DEAH box helicase [Nitrospiraceae bacterium]|nr:DEAD/DEAH box helicase [Nitrospiraceae bacterium]
MTLSRFHPILAEWFEHRIGIPTEVQQHAWAHIQAGHDALIAAPTGSGKTLAAFFSCINLLFQKALACELDDRTHVLYVSPLKALSNDVQKNLHRPLTEIGQAALSAGLLLPELRVLVRTGDTSMAARQQMLRRPPHILITTPESLFILLTAEKSRRLLHTVHTVIVDEIHAVASSKRGAHLALSLERLEALTDQRPQRIGLSATQRPIETVAQFLVGARPLPVIADVGHRRELDVAVEVPKDELGAVATNAIWKDIYDRIAELVQVHRSTLVFVNTRRLAERVSHSLEERLAHMGAGIVAAHHGSLSKEIRLAAEDRLKGGQARVVVATASLELGIDVGTVDLVCQIGSPRSIATCLQRIGRAGHWISALPKGRLFATTRDELVECAALLRAIKAGTLDRIEIPERPLDVMAQQLVAAVATQAWDIDDLYALVRRAYSYRNLDRSSFDDVLEMLATGIATSRGRGHAYVQYDRINRRVRGRRGARLAAITSGGAIPETANYTVIAEPDGTVVGSVDEDFAVESLAGDIILLGNTSWRIRGVESGKMRVENAHGAPPSIPFWRGEAPSRTAELSAEVAGLRAALAHQLFRADPDSHHNRAVIGWVRAECGLDQRGAEQVVAYLVTGHAILGAVPTQQTIVAERFFDESGGMQLVIHAPFGGRVNRAWGLALRKRFCVTFDFELQAAATDEGIVISLGERHSFPLASVFEYLRSETVQEVLLQAVLQAPMFMTRWRWNATRALALLRFSGGKRVPPQIQRMRSEDLLAAVFPDALACQDNFHGDRLVRQVPDHPLVQETLRDCLTEAMDTDGLVAVLQRIEQGTISCLAVDTPLPSPFCHEILNANPYAYLDDAPLEERRARAVEMRRSLPPELADAVGALDPAAIAEVAAESWPAVRDSDELHDALLTLVWVPVEDTAGWAAYAAPLTADRRLLLLRIDGRIIGWMPMEYHSHGRILFPRATADQAAVLPDTGEALERSEVIDKVMAGWMESIGPTTADELAQRLHFDVGEVNASLLRLEAQGQILRGRFRPSGGAVPAAAPGEWCHRRLLARIHRLTIGKLRKDIEPVTATEFMRFLFQWQHVAPGSRMHGEAGLLEVIGQLGGYEAAASAWEPHLLRIRLAKYNSEILDRVCLSGAVAWGRLDPHPKLLLQEARELGRRIQPSSVAPIGIFLREDMDWLLGSYHQDEGNNIDWSAALTAAADQVYRYLSQRGASFFHDLTRGTGCLAAEIEDALWELVTAGLVTADGFDNLRALMDPRRRRAETQGRGRRPRHVAGRWSLLRSSQTPDESGRERLAERMATKLLRRYGVVFRDLVRKEGGSFWWRDLLVQYRRMELRGEVRGGRFVNGFTGEQFALPEAVEALRAVRKKAAGSATGMELRLSASDPLNLIGVILPGSRIPAVPWNFVVFKDGEFVRAIFGRESRAVTSDEQVPALEQQR